MLQASGTSDKGRIRPTNQDHFAIHPDLQLCIVADGMGGHNAGEVASTLAIDAIVDYLKAPVHAGWPFGFDPRVSEPGNRLRTAIHLANARLLEMSDTCSDYAGMGTTVVAVLVHDGTLSVGHVGDSRVYRYRQGRLMRLTQDDSWIASMLAEHPEMDPNSLRDHPMRNVITNVVGATTCTDVHVLEQAIEQGDVLLLTTDGVHGVVDDAHLERLLSEGLALAPLSGEMVQAALARGSRDNCTAVVAKYTND